MNLLKKKVKIIKISERKKEKENQTAKKKQSNIKNKFL